MNYQQSFLLITFISFLLGSANLKAQRVHFSQIEIQPDGKYYQINTIPPFTGIAYDVYPPETSKEKAKAKENYENYLKTSKVREEVTFKNGIKEGKAIGYDQFKVKLFQSIFVNGKKSGLEEQWYARGEKKLEIMYENDVPNGIATEWFKNGNKKSEGRYTNGFEEGLHTWWFEDGQKDQEVPYIKGLVNGTIRNWYPNGNKKLESEYKENKHHGKTTEWFGNGKMKAKGTFENGLEQGTMEAWARTGQILDEKIYEKGELIKSKDYRSAGIRTSEGFVQVFNELESNYSVNIYGDEVRAVNTGNIGFVVDGKILQLHNVSFNMLGNNSMSDKEAIQKLKSSEIQNAGNDFGVIPETEEKSIKLSNGLEALYWKFEVPVKKGKENVVRRILEEHFIAIAVRKDVLLISGAVTNNDRTDTVERFLKNIADSISASDNPIDLNAIRKAAINK